MLGVKMRLLFLTLSTLFIGSQCYPAAKNKDFANEAENIHERIYINNNIRNDLRMYEGDINIPSEEPQSALIRKRNAVRDRKRLWINKLVPYEFAIGFPEDYKQTVREAIQHYHNKTCIRFKPRTTESQWILFVHKKGCWSSVGRSYWMDGSGQEVSLGANCNHVGTALHEMMHALGFWHEQSRPDRNQYVEIFWENIKPGEEYNFKKYSHGVLDTLKIPYDYDSIMHYGQMSFSHNGKKTIDRIRSKQENKPLGQREGFTDLDVRELNALYDCKESDSVSSWSQWSDYGPCDLKNCQKYRQRYCTSDNFKDCPGADYYGIHLDLVKCSNEECYAPIDGHWGRWGEWDKCSKTCGQGLQRRKRKCEDPAPKYNGKNCTGSDTSQQMCKERSCLLGKDDCDFDDKYDNLCHWTAEGDKYKWERISGYTPSSQTGPAGDHTLGSGHYMYAEASNIPPGDRARLKSKEFPATEGRCMSFWYHMLGTGIGSLRVIIKDAKGENQIWMKQSNQGSSWELGKVTVHNTGNHQVIFEAERGQDFRSDIAIDDIKFEEGPCVEEVGCFTDNSANRTLPVLFANLRKKINWFDIRKTVRDCAVLAEKNHYSVYGVQFYGECWGGKAKIDFTKQKTEPDRCWAGVGKNYANFVYKIV